MPPTVRQIDEEIHAVLAAPTTSGWLTQALRDALDRDCVDAAREAQLLALLLGRRCDAVLIETIHATP
jgi:hypothetical protein